MANPTVVTVAILQDRLALFEAALAAVSKNQSYTIGNTTYTRSDARWITEQIGILESRIANRTGLSSRVQPVFTE